MSHIIEDLEISDTEEMINTVHGVEQEKIFREGKKHFHCRTGIESDFKRVFQVTCRVK